MTPEDVLTRFAGSPALWVHKIDLVAGSALLVELRRDQYRSASFLDDRALAPGTSGLWLPLSQIAAVARTLTHSRPLHFIWHTGHVGSTLVSRLLDELDGVVSLREPLALRTLADATDALDRVDSLIGPAEHQSLLTTLLACWGRGYEDTRSVVVKATSVTARVARVVSRHAPGARSVYLNVQLEPYLAGSLVRGSWPLDLRAYGPERIRRLKELIATPVGPLWSLSVGELAAMSWLTETLTERDVRAELGERVLPLNFDVVLADLGSCMARLLDHLALPCDDDTVGRLVQSPVLGRHSKVTSTAFSPAHRKAALDDSRARNREEIQKGRAWVESLARSEPSVAAALTA